MNIQKLASPAFGIFCIGALTACSESNKNSVAQASDLLKPNILWITCEDMSPHLGAWGDSLARTPNIDKLAADGVRFINVYSVSGVCAPSRSALITGQYPTSYGAMHMRTLSRTSALAQVKDPEALRIPVYEAVPAEEVKCFTEFLRSNGYYCTNNVKTDYQFRPPLSAWDETSDTAHWRNRARKDIPFFSVFNFGESHESRIWVNEDLPLETDPEKIIIPPYYPDTKTVREDLARMYDNIARMDERVGVLIDQLEEDNLLDKTIIFFFSDHGDGTPRAKRWLYDSGLKVPLIIRYPFNENGGSIDTRLISFVDFAPTVLSLAGVDIPGYMHGTPFQGDSAYSVRNYIYAAKDRMDPSLDRARAVRDKRFKYIKNYQPEKPFVQFIPYRDRMAMMREMLELNNKGGLDSIQSLWFRTTKPAEELYDTWQDPHEVNNLAGKPEYTGVLHRMRKAHLDWQEDFGDMGGIPETKLVKMLWGEDGKQPVTAKVDFYIEDDSLYMHAATPGASIVYQTPESMKQRPGYWYLYHKPLPAGKHEYLKAMAHRIGYAPGEVVKIIPKEPN